MTSFRVQFEKLGRGLLQEAKRRAVLVKAKGDEKRVSVLYFPFYTQEFFEEDSNIFKIFKIF